MQIIKLKLDLQGKVLGIFSQGVTGRREQQSEQYDKVVAGFAECHSQAK